MTVAVTQGTLSESDHSAQLRKAVIASTIGTAIEWYDFFLYGTAAGLIFGKLYFPNEDPLTATLAAFGTYFIGFVGRPIGAAIFGHYGDRIGRKATLIATLLCMGVATFLIAFVPTYASIGIWGAVILTVLRMFQGMIGPLHPCHRGVFCIHGILFCKFNAREAAHPAGVSKSGFIHNPPDRGHRVGDVLSGEAGPKEHAIARNTLKISHSARKFLSGKE